MPLEWKKVYASYDSKSRTAIEGAGRIRITSKNYGNGTEKTLVEINSGWFNIKEKQTGNGIRRIADFNREMVYPDYIEYFRFNNEPEIRISEKTLEQRGTSREGNEKAVKMFTPGTEKSTGFLDWLKLKTIVKDLSEYINKLFE